MIGIDLELVEAVVQAHPVGAVRGVVEALLEVEVDEVLRDDGEQVAERDADVEALHAPRHEHASTRHHAEHGHVVEHAEYNPQWDDVDGRVSQEPVRLLHCSLRARHERRAVARTANCTCIPAPARPEARLDAS